MRRDRSTRLAVATSPDDTLLLASVESLLSRLAFSMCSSGNGELCVISVEVVKMVW